MAAARQIEPGEPTFGMEAAGRLMTEVVATWVLDLGLLVERIESMRPSNGTDEWYPGAVVRLPFSAKLCHDGRTVAGAALMALAETAMLFACAAACNGYRPIAPIDQTYHFFRTVDFDVLADARVIRVSRNNSFGRILVMGAADRLPVGMVSSAFALL
jgi:hypothetical protein